jgi:Uma2 family endonuclease
MSPVVRGSAKDSKGLDPTFYPVEEKVGEDILHRWIIEMLRPLVERWLHRRGVRALVGADQFIYYQQHAPTLRVSPDVYVLPGIAPHTRVPSWKTWERGIVPSFVLEVVSKDWEKDYIEGPERYAAIGVSELVIFDPAPARHPDGVAWQVYRRVRGRPLTRVEVSTADRMRSRELGCFLRTVGDGNDLRLRIGTGPGGGELFPTGEEAERAARMAAEAAAAVERTAKEAALAAGHSALAARDAALARIAELEEQLRRRTPRRPRRS